MLLAYQNGEEQAVAAAGWFLEHAWLIPLIPGIAFAVIILIGKRLPFKGAEVGIASMVASLVIAIGVTVQWIDRVRTTHEATPVIKSWIWWQSGGIKFGIG